MGNGAGPYALFPITYHLRKGPMAITIQVTDNVTPLIQSVRGEIRPERLVPVVGQAASNAIRDHFFGLNAARPNQLGGRRTNFWSGAAKGTNWRAEGDTATVSIAKQGFRLRLQGGTVRPVRRKFLTIPAVAEAHGKLAGEFPNLRFGFAENKYGNLAPALVEASSEGVKFGGARKDGTRNVKRTGARGGKAIFWLIKKAFHPADPSVLPSKEQLSQAILGAISTRIARLRARRTTA